MDRIAMDRIAVDRIAVDGPGPVKPFVELSFRGASDIETPASATPPQQPIEAELAAALAQVEELRQAVHLREAFIASIGHELRNPMVPILLSVERLRAMVESGDRQRLIASVAILGHATDAFMRRAEQLLDLSRLGNTGFILKAAPCDLSALVRDTAERHREIARRAGCPLLIDVKADLHGATDQAALEQLLDNLLSNAFKYGAGRPVGVLLRRGEGVQEGCAVIGVTDQGQGIAQEEQAHIFELFKRARDPGAPGLGVGLWIVSRLAESLGGSIAVSSAPDAGASFTLTLPLAAATR